MSINEDVTLDGRTFRKDVLVQIIQGLRNNIGVSPSDILVILYSSLSQHTLGGPHELPLESDNVFYGAAKGMALIPLDSLVVPLEIEI